MKPYDKIADSQCPSCSESLLFKGRREWNLEKDEILWGCCGCEIEGSYIVKKGFKISKEKKK